MIAYLADRLETTGAKVEVLHDETARKTNLFATLGPEADGGILLFGHGDAVPVTDQPWSTDPFKTGRTWCLSGSRSAYSGTSACMWLSAVRVIDQAHKADEYLSRDQLAQCLSALKRLSEKCAMTGGTMRPVPNGSG